MNLHLTRDEADRLTADGRAVLFRAGVECCKFYRSGRHEYQSHRREFRPPAEFVEAAKPCETCDGIGVRYVDAFGQVYGNRLAHDLGLTATVSCPDCLVGKRRIAAVVPAIDGPGTYGPTTSGTLTVATVVVEWGPWPVVDRPSRSPDKPCVTILPRGMAMLWPRDGRPEDAPPGDIILDAYPPDVDPQALDGQYTLAVTSVSPPVPH